MCMKQKVSQLQYYSKLLEEEPKLQNNFLSGHMDRGAQARTTDCLDYLYHYQRLLSPSTTLKVTDNTPHYPVGMGFLCLPAQNTPRYVTFYMMMLPATILSPSVTDLVVNPLPASPVLTMPMVLLLFIIISINLRAFRSLSLFFRDFFELLLFTSLLLPNNYH